MKKILALLLCLFLLPLSVHAQRAAQVDILLNGVVDNSNNPLALGKVYTYVPGTTTNKDMWTAYDKSGTAANPVILDAYGRAQVYGEGSYKLVIKTAADVTISTIDNVYFGLSDTTKWWAGAAGGSANALTATPSPAFPALVNGTEVSLIATATNTTTTPTLAVSGLTAKTIVHSDGSALLAGDIVSGTQYTFRYYSVSDHYRIVSGAAERTYYGLTTGSANAYVLAPSPALSALKNGVRVTFEASFSNTSTATLNVSGLGAIDLNDAGDIGLSANDLLSGHTYTAVYESSTNAWLLLNPTYATNAFNPTFTLVANADSADTSESWYYFRLGNTVTVWGLLNVNPTAAGPTNTQVGISMPIASDFTGSGDCGGVCAATASTSERSIGVHSDSTNNRCEMQWATADSGNHTAVCHYSYIIK